MQTACNEMPRLEEMRAELDAIDRRLLNALSSRLACCRRIAELKKVEGIAMMQPHRVSLVKDRAAAFAEQNNIDAAFMRRLYDLLIEETCRVEDAIIAR